jgi:hypothetical protein
MTIVILNDNYQVIQQNHNTFSIQFPSYSEPIIHSITKNKVLLGTTTTNDFQTLIFKATSVKSFPEFKQELFNVTGKYRMPASLVAKLAADLGGQLEYLINRYNMTIIGMEPKDLIVIDDYKFVYLSGEYLAEINEKNATCMICFPVDVKKIFAAPEFFELKEIPAFIHYKASYFSFGCLLLYSLMENIDFYDKYVKEKDLQQITECLNNLPILGSKLFWLIERCLVLDPKKRSILFI